MTPTNPIGKLCVGGDWAMSNGDFEALGDIARQLAEMSDEPLHCQLVALSALCREHPDRASVRWSELKLAIADRRVTVNARGE